MILKQKVHFKAIFGNVGLILHVPVFIALLLALICMVSGEIKNIFPFIATAVVSMILGQLLYHLYFHPSVCNLWDAMITVALSWLVCSIVAAFPFYWISQVPFGDSHFFAGAVPFRNFLNSFFEAMSGLTTTGLTILDHPSDIPPCLQLWRSLLQWVGGIGLVIFILSIVETYHEQYSLAYAEGKSEKIAKNVKLTAQKIWAIYFAYTFMGVLLLWASGMDLWTSLNHSMTAISTGGFSITDDSMASFSNSSKIVVLFIMILGATSFMRHYWMIRNRSFRELWISKQHRVLYLTILLGSLLVILLDRAYSGHFQSMDATFQWISSLVTCGFTTTNVGYWFTPLKLLLIFAMFMGGASGSAAGGFKMRRVIDIFSGVILRVKSLTNGKERPLISKARISHISVNAEEPPASIPLTERTQRLYTANILFTLWILVLLLGWMLLLLIMPQKRGLDMLFEATSAMSNVGISTGIVSHMMPAVAKGVLIVLMWVGRLEIIPVLILFLTFPLIWKKNHEIAEKKKVALKENHKKKET